MAHQTRLAYILRGNIKKFSIFCLVKSLVYMQLNKAKYPQRETDTGVISHNLIEASNWIWFADDEKEEARQIIEVTFIM